jgi:hypothetical protein
MISDSLIRLAVGPTSNSVRREVNVMKKVFQAVLQKSPSKGGWTYVVMEGSAEYFGTRG